MEASAKRYVEQILNQLPRSGGYSSSNPVRVTILVNEWGWRWGLLEGKLILPTEFSKQLARFPHVKVSVLVPEGSCDALHKRDAENHNFTIFEAKKQPGLKDPNDWLYFPPKGLTTDIVIGMGERLCEMAQIFKKLHHCKSIFFSWDSFEESLSRDSKLSEVDVCLGRSNVQPLMEVADLPVAVGPKMADKLCVSLSRHKKEVFKLTPGILSEFADVTHTLGDRKIFRILIAGHGHPRYFYIDGLDFVARAVVGLKDISYAIVFVGAAESYHTFKEFVEKFHGVGVPKHKLIIRSPPKYEEEFKRWLCEADLAIMPSAEQEFGMFGLAALSSGLPILVHGASGLGEALTHVPGGSSFIVESEDVSEWSKAIKKVRDNGRRVRLEEADLLRKNYNEKYSWEKQCGDLVEEMLKMASDRVAHSSHISEKYSLEKLSGALVEEMQKMASDRVAHSSHISEKYSLEKLSGALVEEMQKMASEASGQAQQLTIQKEDGEELESEQEQEPDRIKIHEGTLTGEDVHWNIKLGSVHLAFPRDSVSEPTQITVHRWKPMVLSPPLQEHEALVSNVIEISSNRQEAFKFKAEVKISFTHSSAGLHGYELVLYKRTDNETGAWEKVTDVEDFKSISDFEEEYQSTQDILNFHFPVVQADITECATYAVVSRLRLSPEFTITSNGGSFVLPEYPSVSVTIPKKAVTSKTRIPLRLKVQEVPGEEFEANDILIGPILRIVCDETVEFLKPVTITLPVSLGDTHHDFPDPTACRVRILFLSSDGEQKEWKEITNDLKNPATFDGMTVKFQVERFSGYSCLIDWCTKSFSYQGVIGYLSSLIWNQPQRAVFFAYFPHEEPPDSRDILYLICCPSQLKEKVRAEITNQANAPTSSDSDSHIMMIPGRDKAYVSLIGGFRAIEEDDMNEFYLQFISDDLHKVQVPIRVIDDKGPPGVKFFKTPKFEKGTLLCGLYFRLSPPKRKLKNTPVEFFGIPVNDEILSNPRPENVLGIGKQFVGSEVYDDLLSRFSKGNMNQKQTIQSFYEALARLKIETQDECFEALVKEMSRYEAFEFVGHRLQEGKVAVCKSLKTNTDVKKIVSEKVEYHWKNLARELGLEDGIIDAISVEQQDKCGECCYQVLQKWYEENGEMATIRRVMVALTRIGLADINNDIVDCLNLRRLDQMELDS